MASDEIDDKPQATLEARRVIDNTNATAPLIPTEVLTGRKCKLNRPTRAHMLRAGERLRQVLELKIAGYTYEEIARQVGITTKTVSRDLYKAIERRNKEISTNTDKLRDLEVQRLDKLLSVLMPKAMAGDLQAVDAVHKNILVRSRLLGLEAPQRQEIDASVKAASVEVKRVVIELPDSGDELTPEQLEADRNEIKQLSAGAGTIVDSVDIVDATTPLGVDSITR